MKQTRFALFALVSSQVAGTMFGCGDDSGPGGSGGNAGEAASAGDGNSGGTSAGKGGTSGGTGAGRGGGSGDGNTSGESGAGGAGGEEIPVTLNFAAKVGSEAFSCASTYTGLGADDSTVHPVDFRFYVHDVRLIDDTGTEVPVALTQDGLWQYEGVVLLDFEDRSGTCSNGTVPLNDVVIGTVPFGTYTGIAFKLGVPFELNHTDIATAPSPLNLSAMFWSWNTGRLFLSILNSVELDGGARFGTILQLGSAGCMGDAASGGVTSCSKPNRPEYSFPTFRPGQDVVVADMREVLKNSNLKTDQCHSLEAECVPMFEELGIDWATGALSSTQSVFRMESR
jgi:uncharacterized repeat protein (TIGR04052 family)